MSWVDFSVCEFEGMVRAADPLVAELRRDARWLVAPKRVTVALQE